MKIQLSSLKLDIPESGKDWKQSHHSSWFSWGLKYIVIFPLKEVFVLTYVYFALSNELNIFNFSVLIFSLASIGRQNPFQQKLFGVLDDNLKGIKQSCDQKVWELPPIEF